MNSEGAVIVLLLVLSSLLISGTVRGIVSLIVFLLEKPWQRAITKMRGECRYID